MQSPDRELTVHKALQLVSPFFETEWPLTDENFASIRPIRGGFVNTLHLLSRSNLAVNEPAALLIRQFGQNDDEDNEEPSTTDASLSAAEQAIMCYEMGRRGWGPKLYGVFPGGRIEEFIDSHTLTAAESMNPKIRQDVARSYARLHTLRLPFSKQTHKKAVSEMMGSMAKQKVLEKGLKRMSDNQEARNLRKMIRSTDWTWAKDLEWVTKFFVLRECKPTLTIGDANYLNILVKTSPSDDCQVMLIDYETAAYSYRGIDIGGHFNERQYCWDDSESNLSGISPPDLDEQRCSFCASYLQELQALGEKLTENDTVEHLLKESQIGRLYHMLCSVALCFRGGNADELEWAGSMGGLTRLMESYIQLYHEFLDMYPV